MPHPLARISRLSPAFAATFLPGSATVPLAERVMLSIFKFSMRMTSNRRAKSLEVFSIQSFLLSACRA
jgi:hypothetical protein